MLTREQILERYNRMTNNHNEYVKKNIKRIVFTYPLFIEKDNMEKDRCCSAATHISYNITTGTVSIFNRFNLNRYSTHCNYSRNRNRSEVQDDEFFERFGKRFNESDKKWSDRSKRSANRRRAEKKQKLLDKYFPLKEFDEVNDNERM